MNLAHPPCGLYRTTRPLESVPAGKLVYFHNHGSPGPGIYLPESWNLNRARWHRHGFVVPDLEFSNSMVPLPAEGFYRVLEQFDCCEKHCTTYVSEQLVQLGYNGDASPLLFIPEITPTGMGIPERGTRIDMNALKRLAPLKVASPVAHDAPAGGLLH